MFAYFFFLFFCFVCLFVCFLFVFCCFSFLLETQVERKLCLKQQNSLWRMRSGHKTKKCRPLSVYRSLDSELTECRLCKHYKYWLHKLGTKLTHTLTRNRKSILYGLTTCLQTYLRLSFPALTDQLGNNGVT